MFAFLNNSHEANVAVYTPDEQMKRAEIFRRTREIEADLQHRIPDWQKRMAAWEERGQAESSRSGRWCGPRSTTFRPAARSYLAMKDGSMLAQGYAPTKHRVEVRR